MNYKKSGYNMKFINILFVLFLLLCGAGTAGAMEYYIDPLKDVWIPVNISTESIMLNITKDTGYAPNGSEVFPFFDNFSGAVLDSSKWGEYKAGSASATIEVVDGKLHLAGAPGVSSSACVQSIPTFTNNIEINIIHEFDSVNYADFTLGYGTPTANGGYQHESLSSGYLWQWQDLTSTGQTTYLRTTSFSSLSPEKKITASQLAAINTTQKVSYLYDSSGKLIQKMNCSTFNRTRLCTPTYLTSSNQATHPDVYYNASSVFGWKYWMAMAPYPGSNDDYENPSLIASNDGFNWYIPENVTNPITPAPADLSDHLADTDLLYDDGKLYIYYLNVSDTTDLKCKSFNGTTVSSEYSLGVPYLSPSVILVDGTYYIYVVDISTPTPQTVKIYSSSSPLGPFSYVQDASISTAPAGKDFWHMNVMDDGTGGYHFLFMCCNQGTSGVGGAMYYGHSDDLFNISLQSTPILSPSGSAADWDGSNVYRASGIPDESGIDVWYGAMSTTSIWNIGFMRIENVSGTWKIVDAERHVDLDIQETSDTTHIDAEKSLFITQGEYSSGLGGNRYIDEVYVRPIISATAAEPEVSVSDMGTYFQVTVSPVGEDLTEYPVKIPGNLLSISSRTESLNISTCAAATTPPVAPVADFTANTTSGSAPFTVQFTDTSTGDPTSWSWDFDNDGAPDNTTQNPIYTFTEAGIYTVNLTVTNEAGNDSEVKENYITVIGGSAPIAAFTGTPTSGAVPLTVTFTDASINATSWLWDFGDGNTSTDQNPTNIYNTTGSYTVNLTVSNEYGNDSELKTNYITVTNVTTPTTEEDYFGRDGSDLASSVVPIVGVTVVTLFSAVAVGALSRRFELEPSQLVVMALGLLVIMVMIYLIYGIGTLMENTFSILD